MKFRFVSILTLLCLPPWLMSLRALEAELEGERMSTEQTLAVLRSTIVQIKTQLIESNTSVTAQNSQSPNYLTSNLKYRIQSPQSFVDHFILRPFSEPLILQLIHLFSWNEAIQMTKTHLKTNIGAMSVQKMGTVVTVV